jgi:hypothetical protein
MSSGEHGRCSKRVAYPVPPSDGPDARVAGVAAWSVVHGFASLWLNGLLRDGFAGHPEPAARAAFPQSSGEATSSPSHQLTNQRFTRLHDYLRHLDVRPLKAGHDAVWHQQLPLLMVERAKSQDPLEHRQDVSDKAGLILGEHHYPVDVIH